MTALEAATRYLDSGLWPIPIPHRAKAPALPGWPDLRLSAAELQAHFNGTPQNIGILLGDDFGTADVDLDSDEAIRAAAELLPETGMIFGRQSKPKSHFFYRADPPIRSKRYLDPITKGCLVELRCRKADGSAGLQTVVPPSTHPEGESICFEPGGDGYPANVDAPVLHAAVARVAAASLLARHWAPERAGRNAAFIALAGALARAGWSLEQAVAFHRALYRALWGTAADMGACEAEVIATFEKHGAGFQTTGKTSLCELVDARATRTALGWLGIVSRTPPAKEAQAAPRPKSFCVEDLLSDDTIAVPEFAVEQFLPKAGLVLLGGRPKEGKSWLACQLGLSMATGRAFGGWLRVVAPGRAHLWALEDQFALTKDKLAKILHGARPDGLQDLRVFADLDKPILEGGDGIIRSVLDEHPAELVILDSLFKLTGHTQRSSDINQQQYDVIDRLRKIAVDYSCAVVVVMHTRKGAKGGDPIENLLGMTGNTAACDAACELKRTGHNGKLTVVGRTVQRGDYELLWHQGDEGWGWSIEGEGSEAAIGETAEDVLAFLEAQGAAKPATIAAGLRKSFGSVWQSLLRLQARGKVTRGADRRWQAVKS